MDNLLNGECDGWTDDWYVEDVEDLEDVVFQELGGGYVWWGD